MQEGEPAVIGNRSFLHQSIACRLRPFWCHWLNSLIVQPVLLGPGHWLCEQQRSQWHHSLT